MKMKPMNKVVQMGEQEEIKKTNDTDTNDNVSNLFNNNGSIISEESRIVKEKEIELEEEMLRKKYEKKVDFSTYQIPEPPIVIEQMEIVFSTDGCTHEDNRAKAHGWMVKNDYDKCEHVFDTTTGSTFRFLKYKKI